MAGWWLAMAACGTNAVEAPAPEAVPTEAVPTEAVPTEAVPTVVDAPVDAPLVAAEPAPTVPMAPTPAAPAATVPAATVPAADVPAATVPAAPAAVEPPPVPRGGATDYALVPGSNALYVVVKYERGTVGAALAHDHVVVATTYSGLVHWDPADPSACRISVDVPTSGLRVDPPGAREKAGLEGPASVEDHPTIEANFNGKKQLDSAAFPTLTFRSTRCAARADGKVDVTGALTIHGVSRPTTVAMAIDTDGTELVAKGRFGAGHADFGMTPFSAAMGAVRNAEPLTFVIGVVGRASP